MYSAMNIPTEDPIMPGALAAVTPEDLPERRQYADDAQNAAPLLLIDPDPIGMERMADFLSASGFRNVMATHDVRRLPELLDKTPPEAVLMNLNQVQIYDLQPLATIRAREHLRHVPVILLGDLGDEEARMMAIELNADTFLDKPVNPRELLLRLRNALSLSSHQDRLAHYDPLTGLPNRAMFIQRLEDALARGRSNSTLAALLHVDLDRFKQINEGLGHKIGDALLRGVAERLEGVLRSGDMLARGESTNDVHTLSHLGGDEFSILLMRLRQPDDAGLVARRILTRMAQPFKIAGRELYVTPSIGIALYPDDGDDASSLLKHADLAMSQAKQSGGNKFDFFSSQLSHRTLERLSLENALRSALEHNEMRLFYQPKVDAVSGRMVGVEALMRWNHPGLGLVGPHRFIPVAEESGLILELGRWALHEACRQAKAWQAQGLDGLHVAVNVSPVQFRQGKLDIVVKEALGESGLDPALLTLELTESAVMSNVETSIKTLHALKELGISLSVDDFGTGFSSLSYLRKFPLDELKIDRTFIMDLPAEEKAVALVNGIVAMARGLGLQLVAEGVETREQYRLLADLQCHLCQGYLFSKPVAADAIPAIVSKTDF